MWPKRYCQGIKDLKLVCTKNDQKKRTKLIQMSQKTTGKRRVKRAGCVLQKFQTNLLMIEHAIFQEESDFQL